MTIADNSTASASYTGTGKLAVLAMIAIALVAATFAWWWNFNRGRQAMAFFGPRAAHLIRTAPTVEILVVGGAESGVSTSDSIPMHGRTQPVYRRIDISKAPGLIHARASLLADSNYVRELRAGKSQSFTEVVRFSDGMDEVLLAITEPDGLVEDVSRGKSMQLIKKTADGWRQFIERNVGATTPPGPARTDPSE
jgi:hypothetical protein